MHLSQRVVNIKAGGVSFTAKQWISCVYGSTRLHVKGERMYEGVPSRGR